MNKSDIVKVIKASTGCSVETKYGRGVMIKYDPNTDLYHVKLNYGHATLNNETIISCDEATYLPAAQSLIDEIEKRISWKQIQSFQSNAFSSMSSMWSQIFSNCDAFLSVDNIIKDRTLQLTEQVKIYHINIISFMHSFIYSQTNKNLIPIRYNQRRLVP
jgi:hypothetical protein